MKKEKKTKILHPIPICNDTEKRTTCVGNTEFIYKSCDTIAFRTQLKNTILRSKHMLSIMLENVRINIRQDCHLIVTAQAANKNPTPKSLWSWNRMVMHSYRVNYNFSLFNFTSLSWSLGLERQMHPGHTAICSFYLLVVHYNQNVQCSVLVV